MFDIAPVTNNPFFLILSILLLIGWFFCLVDIVRSRFKDGTVKALWFLFVLFLPLLGMMFYIIIGRGQRQLNI
jgi:hypothetical protein